jgi:hypothetical protein
MFLILPHRLLQPMQGRPAILHGCCSWCIRMGFIGSLGPRYCIYVCLYVYVCVWLLCSSVFTCGVFWVLCEPYVGLLSIAPHPFMNTQVVCLAAAARMACCYLKVCKNGLIPAKLLVDALRFLKKSGLLSILWPCKLKVLWAYGFLGFWYVCWLVEWSYGLMVLCSGGRYIKQQFGSLMFWWQAYGLTFWWLLWSYVLVANLSRSTLAWLRLYCRGGSPQRSWQ